MEKEMAQIIRESLSGVSDMELCQKYDINKKQLESYKKMTVGHILDGDKEPLSYAVQFYQDLIAQRQFTTFLKENLDSNINIAGLQQIVTLHSRPTYGMVYSLRKITPPVDWYYKVGEKKPAPVEFNNIHDVYYPMERSTYMTKKTCAHVYFDLLKDACVYSTFCRYFNLSKNYVGNYVYMRRIDGKRVYRTRPVFPFVNAIKTEISPDYWYIFPDEIPDFDRKVKAIAGRTIRNVLTANPTVQTI